MLRESKIEKLVRGYLENKGWKLTNLPKGIGCHGCDITAWHPKWRKVLMVEVKGEGTAKAQTMHNSFYNILGQIVSRMDKEGNKQNKARIYGIAVPAEWEDVFRRKIKTMTFMWKSLGLKVFLVNDKKVEEKNFNYFLKNKNGKI